MRTEWLNKEQHVQSRALWEEAFPEDSAAFLDTYYAGKGFENEIAVIRDDAGSVCSMIHWNPRTFCFYGHDVPTAYLVAVATGKKFRRHGLMRQLMIDGLHACEKRGLPFVFLTPVSDVYYTPFGFTVVSDAKAVRLTASKEDSYVLHKDGIETNVILADADKCGAYEVRALRPAEYAPAARWCNTCLFGQYTYFIRRDVEYFTSLAAELESEGGELMVVYVQDKEWSAGEENVPKDVGVQPAGTGTKRLAGIFQYTTDGGLEVREPVCMATDKQLVYEAIYNWAEQKEAYDRKRQGNIDDQTGKAADGSTETERVISLTAVTMVRILSLEKCVACLRSKELLTQRIRVSDPLFLQNNGDFLLRLSPDGCSLTRIKAPEESGMVCSQTPDVCRQKKPASGTPEADCLCYTIEEITSLLFEGGYQNEMV